MIHSFDLSQRHTVVDANINFIKEGRIHPTRHVNWHLFILVLEGGWELWQDDERYNVKKGDVFIYQAHRTQHGKLPCIPGTSTAFFHVLGLEGDGCFPFIQKNAPEGTVSLPSSHLRISGDAVTEELFRKMVVAFHSNAPTRNAEMSALFDLIVCHLNKICNEKNYSDLADKALALMCTRVGPFYTLSQLADELFISKRTLSSMVKQRTGMGVHAYQLQKRLETAARQLLNDTDRPISVIAEELGFYDAFHFSKQFKKAFGFSPSQYRAHNAE